MNNNALLIILIILFIGIISVALTIGSTGFDPAKIFSNFAQSEEFVPSPDAYDSAAIK